MTEITQNRPFTVVVETLLDVIDEAKISLWCDTEHWHDREAYVAKKADASAQIKTRIADITRRALEIKRDLSNMRKDAIRLQAHFATTRFEFENIHAPKTAESE